MAVRQPHPSYAGDGEELVGPFVGEEELGPFDLDDLGDTAIRQ